MAKVRDGTANAQTVRAAMTELATIPRGAWEEEAVLRCHLSRELEMNVDDQAAMTKERMPPSIDLSQIDTEQRPFVAAHLVDLGFSSDGAAPVAALRTTEEIGDLSGSLQSQEAKIALCPEVSLPGHWYSHKVEDRFGGFMHGGDLIRRRPDAESRFRLIGGRYHHAKKSPRVLSIQTEIALTVQEVDATDAVSSMHAPGPEDDLAHSSLSWFHGRKGQRAFLRQIGEQPGILGWSQGSGHEKHGHALFGSLCRTTAFTDRLAKVSTFRSARSLGKKVPLQRHQVPTGAHQIADRIAPQDPFSAYYNPKLSTSDEGVIFASPYLRLISVDPERGPAIIMYLRAYREVTSGRISRDVTRIGHRLLIL
ncbi:MAG: hypothetical protein AAGF33_14590 [Pseudomonadota bacterium]